MEILRQGTYSYLGGDPRKHDDGLGQRDREGRKGNMCTAVGN